jgi:hypothetical protein
MQQVKIPASAIRPFEPHGLPKTYIGEQAVKFLVTAIAKGIIAVQLDGMTKRDLTETNMRKLNNRIADELIYGGLTGVFVRLILTPDNEELHCTIDYSIGGKSCGVSAGWALFE